MTDDPDVLSDLKNNGSYAVPILDGRSDPSLFPHTQYALENIEELMGFPVRDLYVEGFDPIPPEITRIYRRLAGLPWDIVTTERLHVREMTVDDVESFYDIYKDPSTTEFMEDLFENIEDEKIYTRNYITDIYGFYGYGLWTVIEKESGTIIGRAGISNRDGFPVPELGFVIGKEYRNKGYAYEVCTAILEYAVSELGFDTVRSFVMPGNTASVNLLHKLGFKKDGFEDLDGTEHIRMIFTPSD